MLKKFSLLFLYGMFNATGALHFLKQGKSEEDALFYSCVYSLVVAAICVLVQREIVKTFRTWKERRMLMRFVEYPDIDHDFSPEVRKHLKGQYERTRADLE